MQTFPIVTLCGSTKFKDEFITEQRRLTLEGYIVLSVGLFGHADDEYQKVIDDETKAMLDDMHIQKIDMSDSIHIINKGGYVGHSTRCEIEYAKSIGKKITYME